MSPAPVDHPSVHTSVHGSVHHGSFTIERSYPHSPARVFRAWADPEAKAAWFHGPDEWVRELQDQDFRVGGHERLVGGPEGGPMHRFHATFHDIQPGRRIVYSYEMFIGEQRMSVSLATVELHPAGSGTRLRFTEQVVLLDDWAADEHLQGREQGTGQLLGQLGQALDHSALLEIENNRRYAASPEALYAAWADPPRLARWWGPAGFTNRFLSFDLRPGGDWRLVMDGPDGQSYPNDWHFEVVEPGRRILARHLGDHAFTLEACFVPEGDGCHLHWTMRFESADFVEKMRGFLLEKNEENFDRLQAELEQGG